MMQSMGVAKSWTQLSNQRAIINKFDYSRFVESCIKNNRIFRNKFNQGDEKLAH